MADAEHRLARLRAELADVRARLLAAVGGVRSPRLSDVSEKVLAVARIVDASDRPLTRADVAKAIGTSPATAGARLKVAVERNLIDHEAFGSYRAIRAATKAVGS